jgi:hypothetical protein
MPLIWMLECGERIYFLADRASVNHFYSALFLKQAQLHGQMTTSQLITPGPKFCHGFCHYRALSERFPYASCQGTSSDVP